MDEKILKWQAVFFDFDGVILDSVDVKTKAFGEMFSKYGQDVEDAVVDYHLQNGGVSRFEKFRYYYQNLLNQNIDEDTLINLGKQFSNLVVEKVITSPFIPGALETLKRLKEEAIPAFVVSGTPDEEIKEIVRRKDLSPFFIEVHGSPRKKWDITQEILSKYSYISRDCIFIGDAMSDYEAADKTNMNFLGIVQDQHDSIFPATVKYKSEVSI